MNRFLLSIMAALALACMARADYLVIIYDLNAKPSTGMMTGGTPMTGGGPPMAGGGPPMGGGSPPMGGGRPPMGGGGPPMGGFMIGGRPPMAGGGPPMGGGMPGLEGDTDELDDTPSLIVGVLDTTVSRTTPLATTFNRGRLATFRHNYTAKPGGKIQLLAKKDEYEALHFPSKTPKARFALAKSKLYADREKPSADKIVGLARKALELGLMDEFKETMEKAAEADKTNLSVVAYEKVKKALETAAKPADLAPWRKKLLEGYKAEERAGSRFTLLHTIDEKDPFDLKRAVERLDLSLKGYYYWWALRGEALPLPANRIVSVLTPLDDFKRVRGEVSAGPVISDSFHAPLQALTVFSQSRDDAQYKELFRATAGLRTGGYNLDTILYMDKNRGLPRTVKSTSEEAHKARVQALLLKVLKEEWLRNAATHEVSRELVYSSGLLPRDVHAPEWLLFGMGSFFEAPLQSPRYGFGSPNTYYLPRFEGYLKSGKYGDMAGENEKKAQLATLLSVVVGAPLKAKAPVKGKRPEKETPEASLRHRRAAYWALGYFLANRELPRLRAFFKALSKQPRDIELDGEVVLNCFARSFECWDDAKGKPDMAKLQQLAGRWFSYIKTQVPEDKEHLKKIREAYLRIAKPATKPGGGSGGSGGGTVPTPR
jgi:hypothetical protein